MNIYNNKEITLVTAFFDISRDSFEVWSRSNDEYFQYFDFWARIQNNLIIYCAPECENRIMSIRKKYRRENETTIVPISNIFEIEPELYQKMKNVENKENFKKFRYHYKALSNRADYDYLMLLKYWFMWDASLKYADKDSKMVWLDFGYNHGDAYYINSEDFDFKWEYEFDDRMNLFCLSDPDEMISVDSLQFQKDCFIGGTVVCPIGMTEKLWAYVKEAMRALLALDCIDDDQQLLLMMYKLHRDECTVRICDWFQAIRMCSNRKFKIKDVNEGRRAVAAGAYEKQNEEFIKRCRERTISYYK